ncbi:MAG: hypothetical protein ACYTGR_20720, partial [Planctomycetota bacterium]
MTTAGQMTHHGDGTTGGTIHSSRTEITAYAETNVGISVTDNIIEATESGPGLGGQMSAASAAGVRKLFAARFDSMGIGLGKRANGLEIIRPRCNDDTQEFYDFPVSRLIAGLECNRSHPLDLSVTRLVTNENNAPREHSKTARTSEANDQSPFTSSGKAHVAISVARPAQSSCRVSAC